MMQKRFLLTYKQQSYILLMISNQAEMSLMLF